MLTRHKEPMSNLIREHRMNVGHMNALVSRPVQPVEEEGDDPHWSDIRTSGNIEPAKPRFTYSIEWDDGPYWDGWNVRCVETGQWMREEGFSTERGALDFLEELENPEGE